MRGRRRRRKWECREKFPVIISNKLNDEQEEKLIAVLKAQKDAIGWSIADIKGISPTTCMHKIFLEKGARLVRQPQRRLNPSLMEVVKIENFEVVTSRYYISNF